MPYDVLPFEGSSRHHVSNSGDLLVSVPQHPIIPSEIQPLMVAQRYVKVSHPTTVISVSGNISPLHLGWEPEHFVILLQDDVSSDILQTYIDITFEFKDALIFISKEHFSHEGGYTVPYADVRRRVHAYMDDWLSHNPWAFVSAVATARYSNQLRAGAGLGPEYAKYAISNFTMESFQAGLGKMSGALGCELRWNADNDPFREGHVEYHVDPTETDSYFWGTRVIGSITLRYKTGRGTIGIMGFGRSMKDYQAVRYVPDLSLGTPTFPDGSRPGVDLGPDIDPDPTTDPDPVPDPDPPPLVVTLDQKKVALNNLLTGLQNFIHNTATEAYDTHMGSANSWTDQDTNHGIFQHYTAVTNIEFGEYYKYTLAGVLEDPANAIGDDSESALLFLTPEPQNNSPFTLKYANTTHLWLREKLFDLGPAATADLFLTMVALVKALDTTGVNYLGVQKDTNKNFTKMPLSKGQLKGVGIIGNQVGSVAVRNDSWGWGYKTDPDEDFAYGWASDQMPSRDDLIRKLNTKSEVGLLAMAMVCWPIAGVESTVGGSAMNAFTKSTWAKYVAFLGFTPNAENTSAVALVTSSSPA